MQSYKSRFLFFCIVMSILSCSRSSFYVIDGAPVDISYADEDNMMVSEQDHELYTIKTAFAGDAISYTIFQLDFENLSQDSILISSEEIYLVDYSTAQKIYPLDKYEEIAYLESTKDEINKQKKRETIGNMVLGGLNLLSFAGGGGLFNTLNGISYGAETSLYILESRREFDFMSGSVEDEIDYIYDWVIDAEMVGPDDKLSVDILFPRRTELREARLVITVLGEEQDFPFRFELKEIRE